MADEKKLTPEEEVTAAEPEKKAEKKAPAKKTPAKRGPKKGAKKAAAEKAPAKRGPRKTAAEKAVAEPKAPTRRGRKKAEPTLDTVTTLLWKKLEKADVSGIGGIIAVQVIVDGMGTFFIAVKDNGEKHIIQAVYNDRDGTLEAGFDEILKMASGGYDYLAAVRDGRVSYQGDLRKAMLLKDFF